MERSALEDAVDTKDAGTLNLQLAEAAIQSALDCGVERFYICPGGRNAPLVRLLPNATYGFEERSTAFHALGFIKRTGLPAAVITTSGTAVAELLPAVMEADYSSQPLLLITADRPRTYRLSGAPQTCPQPGIFSHYISYSQDVEAPETPTLRPWDQSRPAHLNLCFDEPLLAPYPTPSFTHTPFQPSILPPPSGLDAFLSQVDNPLVIVGTVRDPESIIPFLVKLNATTYFECTSNLREDPRLAHLSTHKPAHYDSILRIGSVPTHRCWRDLEKKRLPVFSIDRFSGLSWASANPGSLANYTPLRTFKPNIEKTTLPFDRYPRAEPSLIHTLSARIPKNAFIYLGNSLPIREWDLAATREHRGFSMMASRGLNGIDGQISTFLGATTPGENWGIFGDLTALYDLAAPWFLQHKVNIVIINNGGGKIFDRMFQEKEFQNQHTLNFEGFAKLWNLDYERWERIPEDVRGNRSRVIEVIPDLQDTDQFWNELKN